MQNGLYVTFFRRDEPPDRELPPVGPLDHVVFRSHQLIAERAAIQQAEDAGVAIDRWLEAELEFQRATGEEPGGTRRPDLRVSSRDGLFLRFTVFGDQREHDPVAELGPFAVVIVGARGVEADGLLLATRPASDLAPWEVMPDAGDQYAGKHKPDIAFRASSGAYHQSIAPLAATPRIEAPFAPAPRASPRVEPAFVPAPRIEPPPRSQPRIEPPPFIPPTGPEPLFKPPEPRTAPPPPPSFAPPAEEPPALTARDLELIERIERERDEETLRARIQEEERRRLGVDETDDEGTTWAMRYRPQAVGEEEIGTEGGLSFGRALWRMRFAVIGLLLVGIGAYGFLTIRAGAAPGKQSQVTVVGLAQKVTGPRWDYQVNSVQKIQLSGAAKPRGEFLVVRILLTAREKEGQQTTPSDFAVVDANGIEYAPESLQSDAYLTNPQVAWPAAFPVGRSVITPLVFDVDPGKKYQLVVRDVPLTRITLN